MSTYDERPRALGRSTAGIVVRDAERRLVRLEREIGVALDRRAFLRAGAVTLTSLVAAACNSSGPRGAQRVLRWAERKNESVERALFRHTSMDHAFRGAPEAGDAFPSYFVSRRVPVWDDSVRGAWTLEVSGAVRRPLRLTLSDLTRLPTRTQRVDHYCVEGWTAVARWTGVPMQEIARLAQPTSDAQYVDFLSFDDGYHESWDLESATHPQTLIVYAQEGHMLSPAYGAPARLFSPVKLGYKNTKYLTRIAFLPQRNGGYWSDQGYEWYGGT